MKALTAAELATLRRVDALKYKSEQEFYIMIRAEGLFETVVILRDLGLVKDEALTKKGEKLLVLDSIEQAKLRAWKARP